MQEARDDRSPYLTRQNVCLLVLLIAGGSWLIIHAYGPGWRARPLEPVQQSLQIDINRANRSELMQVPGIGPELASEIISNREQVGRFDRIDDLARVHGIGPKTIDRIRPWFRVDEALPPEKVDQLEKLRRTAIDPNAVKPQKIQAGEKLIDPNSASVEELMRLPGVGQTLADRIVISRNNAPFKSVEDLRRVKGIGAKTLESIRPFVSISE